MDYAVALIVYLASIFGALISMGGMFAAKDEPKMVGFFSLCIIVFSFTTYLGGLMLQNVN
jgi:hypothetical protein